MKKFNPDKEFEKLEGTISKGTVNNKAYHIPILILSCAVLTTLGFSFSSSITSEQEEYYTIKVEIINGEDNTYIKRISKKDNNFSDVLSSDASFGNLVCTKGALYYDHAENRIYNPDVREDISCIIAYMNDGSRKIDFSNLNSIPDNTGISYYFKGDSSNNYLKINDTLFRIVRINGNGDIRLITEKPISIEANKNNIKEVLNNWYNDTLSNVELITEADYDTTNYEKIDTTSLINYDGYSLDKVGLLSVKEAKLINEGITSSFLQGSFSLANDKALNETWSIKDGEITTINQNENLPVRPVINLKSTNLKGEGTIDNPYELA